ncbi:MAG: hypothetical protein FJ022_05550 [Chloroflexi bacterium]|nr:hypothetical protein [Chloroflexota bacterium]MBM4450253.1 hypothetical protein [Chloroflexota bacterium]
MKNLVKIEQIYIVLLPLIVFGLLSACSNPVPAAEPTEKSPGPPDRVDIVYFHLGEACHCMDPMGDCIHATIFLNFQEELHSGRLTFQRLKLDDKNNAAIDEKYNAAPFTLFINIVTGNTEHIIAVPEILSVRYDREALEELVKTKIEKSLNGIDEDFEK